MIAALLAAAAAAQTPPASPAPAAHPFILTVKVDKDQVTLGEPFVVTVRIDHPALDVYALPEPLAVEPLGLRGAPSVSRGAKADRAETIFELPLVNLKTLDPRLPPLLLPAASSGRQIGALIISLGQGGIYGYLRGRVTGLPADSGQSARRGIEATGFLPGRSGRTASTFLH